jgi:hypothetical protein
MWTSAGAVMVTAWRCPPGAASVVLTRTRRASYGVVLDRADAGRWPPPKARRAVSVSRRVIRTPGILAAGGAQRCVAGGTAEEHRVRVVAIAARPS